MNKKLIGIILLVVGCVLLFFGFNATGTPTEQISEALTGRYSDRTMIYLIVGGVATALGIALTLRK